MTELVFVARERELARLRQFLNRALAGQGQVCFVTGEAGSGKTALVTEFARRAQERHKSLIVAVGQGDAETGVGDPYLPFRAVLSQLTGDVEAELAQGAITQENAGRLRKLLRLSGQALVELGPELIGIFVPGAGLAMRVGTFAAEKVGWLEKLEQLTGRPRESAAPGSVGIEQSHIFEQYTNVLRALATQRPLMLVLDDFQWADAASIGLLFRLGRRIGESKILIVGTYRPDEVALGRAGERHPLEKVLAEFKRYFGDVLVTLDQAEEAERRQFVDAVVGTEPNQLGEGFRQALYQHTDGHPLFTIELLRDMQERGDIVRDEQGRWIEGPVLDWGALPARVEGVIEERLGRLEQEPREALTVGSVEGEDFTAEVVARVQATDVRGLIRRLSGELEKQHRLVSARGIRRLGAQRLSLYQFRHNLFQKYLYNDLDEVERAVLHEDVGNVLEELYGDQVDEITVQLARHFAEAGMAEKAVTYLRRAGEQAAAQFANAEAMTYLSRALDLTPETDTAERYALLLAREKVYDVQGAREAQRQDLATLKGLAEALADDGRRAEVALRQANYAEVTGDYPTAVAAAQATIRLAQAAQDMSNEAAGYLHWGLALWRQGDYEAARPQLEQAQALAQGTRLRQASSRALSRAVEAGSLRYLGIVSAEQGDYAGAEVYFEQALRIFREIDDRRGESAALNALGVVSAEQGDYAEARVYFEQALRIFREIGERLGESKMLNNLSLISKDLGDYTEARTYFEQSLRVCREIDDREGEGVALNNLGEISAEQGDYARARGYFEQALRILREIGNRRVEGIALGSLGLVYLRLGNYAGTRAYFEQSLRILREIGDRQGEGLVLAHLGLLSHQLGDDEAARGYSQQALLIAQDLDDRPTQGYALTLLGHALASLGHRSTEAHERLAEAAAVYRQALTLRRELGQPNLAMEPLAGLARVFLAQGNLAQAQARVEEVLSHLKSRTPSTGSGHSLDGTAEPFRVHLTCYRVLRANQDSRAQEVLTTAHTLLQEQAVRIDEKELRRSFLENVAAHREILSEWANSE